MGFITKPGLGTRVVCSWSRYVRYCCVTDEPKTWWLETTIICYWVYQLSSSAALGQAQLFCSYICCQGAGWLGAGWSRMSPAGAAQPPLTGQPGSIVMVVATRKKKITFQVSVCVEFIMGPLAKISHTVKPQTVCKDQRLWTQEGVTVKAVYPISLQECRNCR